MEQGETDRQGRAWYVLSIRHRLKAYEHEISVARVACAGTQLTALTLRSKKKNTETETRINKHTTLTIATAAAAATVNKSGGTHLDGATYMTFM